MRCIVNDSSGNGLFRFVSQEHSQFSIRFLHSLDIFSPQSNSEINVMLLLVTIFYACYPFVAVGIVCELGQRGSELFNEINHVIDQFDWYAFPHKLQRMLPIVINIARIPVVIECFGSIACNRDAFKQVRFTMLLSISASHKLIG